MWRVWSKTHPVRPPGAAPINLVLPHVHVLGHRGTALEGRHAGEVRVVVMPEQGFQSGQDFSARISPGQPILSAQN